MVMFVHPALTRNERRYLYLLMPGVILFFLAGAAFGYYVFLPPALKFLLHFPWYDVPSPFISIGDYISVVTKFLLAMGLIFELPLLMFFLTKIGVVSPKGLSKFRKFAFLGAFVLAGFLTPTVDPINQTIVAIPIILLYEIGILLSRLARRGRPAAVKGQV
jgi:sec-independent protein translocase protein TatC